MTNYLSVTLPITLPQRQAYGSDRGRQSYASNFPGVEKEANLLCRFKFNSFTLQFHVVFHLKQHEPVCNGDIQDESLFQTHELLRGILLDYAT